MVQSRAVAEIPEVVAPAAYYAMYHAAVAALIHVGIARPSSDLGMVKRFTRQFGLQRPMHVNIPNGSDGDWSGA